MPTDIYQVHESDLSQCIPPVNGYNTYTVYAGTSLTISEGAISGIQQGETYVITIVAFNGVGEGEPAMLTIGKI